MPVVPIEGRVDPLTPRHPGHPRRRTRRRTRSPIRLAVIGFTLVLPGCGHGSVKGEVAATATSVQSSTSATSTSTTIAAEPACHKETVTDTNPAGVSHDNETICTWGPGLLAHLDSRGFVDGAQNHPLDLAMAQRCWAAGGRVYLRSPAVRGWG